MEVGASRPSPGSVGKLRISNEMKHKLEMVTANHSLRSTTGKPRPQAMNNMPTPPAGKLDSDRRLLLQQQLGKSLTEIKIKDLKFNCFKLQSISNLIYPK